MIPERLPSAYALAGAGVGAYPGPVRVLVADGYPDAADSLALLLRLWGHEALVGRTGPEALAIALAYRPEVALVDLVLPGMDGCQLAHRLRAEEGLRGVVLIAVTGLGDPASRRRSHEAGFGLHLLKPLDPDELQAILATLEAREREAP